MTEMNKISVGVRTARVGIMHNPGLTNKQLREQLQRFAKKNAVTGLSFHRDYSDDRNPIASLQEYAEFDVKCKDKPEDLHYKLELLHQATNSF